MSTPAEWHPDDDLDAALRKQLRQIYRERFDITQDGAAAHTHDEVVADGGLRLWLRELARAETWLDQRTLFAVTGLPLPLAPMPACSAIWDFKRAARYRAEIMRDLHENVSVICNDLLRHQQQARRLPLDVSLVFRLPAPIVALFPVRDLLNATLPHICHLFADRRVRYLRSAADQDGYGAERRRTRCLCLAKRRRTDGGCWLGWVRAPHVCCVDQQEGERRG